MPYRHALCPSIRSLAFGTYSQRNRGMTTAATGLPGFPGCFLFWGRLREARCRCCRGWSCSCVLAKQQVVVLRRATATPREAANPRTAQEGRRGRRRNFPRPPGRAGTSRRPRRWRRKRPTKLRGRRYVAHGTSHQDPAKRAAGETDGNQGENTGTYSNRTLGGTDFRVEPPEHTSCSLLRSRRCSDPNPAPVGDTDWLWFQVIGQKRDSRQVRRKRLGSNSASSPPQIPVPRGKPCRQESHIWRRCRRLKWSLGHWNCRHTVSAARRPGCCAAHRWTEAITRFLVLWAVIATYK